MGTPFWHNIPGTGPLLVVDLCGAQFALSGNSDRNYLACDFCFGRFDCRVSGRLDRQNADGDQRLLRSFAPASYPYLAEFFAARKYEPTKLGDYSGAFRLVV